MSLHNIKLFIITAQPLPKADSGKRKPLAMNAKSNTLPRMGRRTPSSSRSPSASPKATRSRGNFPLPPTNGSSTGRDVRGCEVGTFWCSSFLSTFVCYNLPKFISVCDFIYFSCGLNSLNSNSK